VGSLVDAGSNLTGAWIVWMELLLKLVILCQYNKQIHRVPAGRIVTNKQRYGGGDSAALPKWILFFKFLSEIWLFRTIFYSINKVDRYVSEDLKKITQPFAKS
jgi:hypothetical protein